MLHDHDYLAGLCQDRFGELCASCLSSLALDRCEYRWQLRDIGGVGAKLNCDDDLRLCIHCGLCVEAFFEAYARLLGLGGLLGVSLARSATAKAESSTFFSTA